MQTPVPDDQDELSDALLEEAVGHFMRVREAQSGDETAAQQLELWLARDARHRHAYAEVQQLWSQTGEPAARVVEEGELDTSTAPWPPVRHAVRREPPSRRGRRVVVGFVAAVAALVALSPIPSEFMLRLKADFVAPMTERDRVDLADGSSIDLANGSAITVAISGKTREVHLIRGRAWFDVAHDPERPFVVITDFGQVQVLGTSFGVDLETNAVVLSVLDGKVAVENETETVKELVQGQRVIFSNERVGQIQAFDPIEATAWRRDQIIFYQTPLAEVIDALSAHQLGKILMVDSRLRQRTVSGAFSTKDPDQSLEIIANTLGLRITRITGLLTVIR